MEAYLRGRLIQGRGLINCFLVIGCIPSDIIIIFDAVHTSNRVLS